MMKGILYKLDFPSGKSYIGITTGSLGERLRNHSRAHRSGRRSAISNAFRKYGNPKCSVLAVLDKKILVECETRAIKVFGTLVPNGYNIMADGSLSPMDTQSIREKVSLALKGRPSKLKGTKLSEEHKRHISGSLKLLGKRNWLGKTHSEETKEKIRLANKGFIPVKAIARAAELRRGGKLSENHKQKISISLIGNTRASSLKGRKRPPRSAEWRENLSKALQGRR